MNCKLDMLQKRLSRTVGPALTASTESLAHQQNLASLSFLYILLW